MKVSSDADSATKVHFASSAEASNVRVSSVGRHKTSIAESTIVCLRMHWPQNNISVCCAAANITAGVRGDCEKVGDLLLLRLKIRKVRSLVLSDFVSDGEILLACLPFISDAQFAKRHQA